MTDPEARLRPSSGYFADVFSLAGFGLGVGTGTTLSGIIRSQPPDAGYRPVVAMFASTDVSVAQGSVACSSKISAMGGHTASAREGWIGRGSTGKRRFCHASNPPASGRIRKTPRLRNRSATRALVASFGQEQ
jgi:hypothetical protein